MSTHKDFHREKASITLLMKLKLLVKELELMLPDSSIKNTASIERLHLASAASIMSASLFLRLMWISIQAIEVSQLSDGIIPIVSNNITPKTWG